MSKNSVIYLARISLFLLFFWFGLTKVLGTSPIEDLIKQLYLVTLSKSNIFTEDGFIIFLGLIECSIGILWLIPKLTKLAFAVFILHMLATFAPLLLLPHIAWKSNFIPTLEGQYIIKNLALIALALTILQDES